ncbi:modification methylase HhaI [Caedimonas varicaedens]|uniref:DNA (cytosine-5-)-methyltransferase n=1 Tax=Caedimonas varicaedens TaxID=1629334 RepID=A0A0K8MAV0_9PROT|nr:modification methylase HhaI [Caedimonas varicaedens]
MIEGCGTFIDLFCGIGGFRVALEQRGLQCVFSSEIDPRTREAYHANFGEMPKGDIRTIDVRKIPPHDILCGGFPCQSFTISGKGESVECSNGKLFYEMMRIVSFHRPKLILLENVRHLLRIDDGEILSVFAKAFEDTGYKIGHHLLNASLYGIPQSRIRVYFVGIREDVPLKSECPQPTREEIYLSDVLEDTVEERLCRDRPDFVYDHPERLTEKALTTLRVGYFGTKSQSQKIYSPSGHAVTQMTDQGKTGMYHINGRVRYLSLMEGRRVMGFPDSHILSSVAGTAQRQLGNAVIPTMVGHVYDNIREMP